MTQALLILAAVLQGLAVIYGLSLLVRRDGAANAWLFLLGAMASMLAWRIVVATGMTPPDYFNPLIAIWGSTCMFGAMYLFGREVGLRQRAEKERDHLLNSERAARTEAERANRFKDEFLANLSHELRTPLAVIMGWCAILGKSKGEKELALGLEIMERNARIQTRLVDDLLDMTRIRSGTLRLDLATLSLDTPVRAAVQDVKSMAATKQLNLHVECKQAPLISGDAARLQQLVSNLLVNAIKFTPAGGAIIVTISEQQGKAVLEVVDTGEGIDPDFLPYLFERFRQQDSSSQRKYGGLGLGLSIVADLVTLHGGHIEAYSAGIGQGATFTVTLPLAVASASDATQGVPVAPLDAGAEQALAGLRIVLIDDEADVRSAVTRMLQQLKVDVIALESGSTIDSVLQDSRPDLLLVDIGMPEEDGYTLIRRIRRISASKGGSTPAIALTAFAREEDRERALSSGFQKHLTKPVGVPELVGAIMDTIKTSRANVAVV